jgi:hypothetical protein
VTSFMRNNRPIVTVDLDSTLCDTGNRTLDRENPDWENYSLQCDKDTPVKATVELISLLCPFYDIHFVSGRDVLAEGKTREWLKLHDIPVDDLWLSPPGDHTAAHGSHAAYKLSRIRDVEKATGRRVALHIDDWAAVKIELEQAGYPCICVRTPQEIEVLTEQTLSEQSSLR